MRLLLKMQNGYRNMSAEHDLSPFYGLMPDCLNHDLPDYYDYHEFNHSSHFNQINHGSD
jgi:hypothetical protein